MDNKGNFKIPGIVVSEISLTQVERWKKGKMEKESKNKSRHLGFLSHKMLDHSKGVYKI